MVLSKTNIVHWFCKRGNSGVMKTVKCVGQLMDRVEVLEEKLVVVETETHNEICKLKDSIQGIEKLSDIWLKQV